MRRAVAVFGGLLRAFENRRNACKRSAAAAKPSEDGLRDIGFVGTSNLAGGKAVTVLYLIKSRLTLPLAMAALVLSAAEVCAQGAFPAPLPSQSNASPFPPANSSSSPFPPVNSASPFPEVGTAPAGSGAFVGVPSGPQAGPPPGGEQCMSQFLPLRQDAEKKAALIKAAGTRHAPPDEACKLIASFAGAEVKMIKFIEANAKKCGIPPEIGKQMHDGHLNTEKMKTTVCNVAAQRQQQGGGGPAAPSLSEALGSSAAIPEARTAKRGGATFETLNGNALTR
jgi:hypothetical protein